MANDNRYISKLNILQQEGNYRFLKGPPPENLVNLSSNDYLGIGKDNDLLDGFLGQQKKFPAMGSCSSRLLTGNVPEYAELENLISAYYNKEACIVFNSGYHANIGILPALAHKNDLILADKLVHASIIDGLKLSDASIQRYKHNNMQHLEALLQKAGDHYENIFIVTESIFSMDGDLADLQSLVKIKNKYHAYLYIDEAHALGVRGEKGLGLAEELNCIEEIDFLVGTFGKALASTGAFVVCNKVFKNYLVNHSRSLIFTTAMAPVNLAWTIYIFKLLPGLNERRKHLQEISGDFAMNIGCSDFSHIIPFIAGSNHRAIELSNTLLDNGFYALPIRHPTVPLGSERIRFSLHAGIKKAALLSLVKILKKYGTKVVA